MGGQFDGKVTLVTGAGSGIGRASALAFAREGARVVAVDMESDGVRETAALIAAQGGEGYARVADVSSGAAVESLVDELVGSYGRLDYAHNNAGILGLTDAPATPAEYPEELFDRVLAVNLKAVWLCMKYEIPAMLKLGRGAIVNTASIMGLVASPGAAYTASKHGVIGLTKSFAVVYAPQGIRVNAICPGYIDTPMLGPIVDRLSARIAATPLGRLGSPEEVATTILWLCSDAASFVTGHAMAVDGGYIIQ